MGTTISCLFGALQITNPSRYSDVLNHMTLQVYNEHKAAVKAIAWSPHHRGLLLSGGGSEDRTLRFWDTLAGRCVQVVNTGSQVRFSLWYTFQVCNVAWSKHSAEYVTTHGYSLNHVALWKYPNPRPVNTLLGHDCRVVYMVSLHPSALFHYRPCHRIVSRSLRVPVMRRYGSGVSSVVLIASCRPPALSSTFSPVCAKREVMNVNSNNFWTMFCRSFVVVFL